MAGEHRWEYCSHCQHKVVICGVCGNNCCNGGYGEVSPGITCSACPDAYAMQDRGNDPIPEEGAYDHA